MARCRLRGRLGCVACFFGGAFAHSARHRPPNSSRNRLRIATALDTTGTHATVASTLTTVRQLTNSAVTSWNNFSLDTAAAARFPAPATHARSTCVMLYSNRQNANWNTVACGVPPISPASPNTSVTCWNTCSMPHRIRYNASTSAAGYKAASSRLVPHHGNGLSRKSEIPYLTRSLDCEEIDRWQGRPRR